MILQIVLDLAYVETRWGSFKKNVAGIGNHAPCRAQDDQTVRSPVPQSTDVSLQPSFGWDPVSACVGDIVEQIEVCLDQDPNGDELACAELPIDETSWFPFSPALVRAIPLRRPRLG